MSAPAVVVFDLGKVLVDFDYHIASRRVAARGKAAEDEIFRILCQSPLLESLERGWVTARQFFDDVREATGFRGSFEEFKECFADIFSEIQPMIELQASLRRGGVPTYVFSNTNEVAVVHIRQKFPFFSHFDGYILSYETGAMKPEPRMYEIVEERTGQKGGAIFYLDDRPENITGAAARDWRALLHESPEKSCQKVRTVFPLL